MKTIQLFALTMMIFFISACDNEIKLSENDYLIFGHFYGECLGENCVETFKLTNDKLFEDGTDNYFGNGTFNFVELANGKFEQTKDLTDYFPMQLLTETETTFGCPDCADQGGIFIQYCKNGVIKSWRIDQSKTNVPTYLHNFVDKVNEKIGLINN